MGLPLYFTNLGQRRQKNWGKRNGEHCSKNSDSVVWDSARILRLCLGFGRFGILNIHEISKLTGFPPWRDSGFSGILLLALWVDTPVEESLR